MTTTEELDEYTLKKAIEAIKPTLAGMTDDELVRFRDKLVERTKRPGLPPWAVAERRQDPALFDLAVSELGWQRRLRDTGRRQAAAAALRFSKEDCYARLRELGYGHFIHDEPSPTVADRSLCSGTPWGAIRNYSILLLPGTSRTRQGHMRHARRCSVIQSFPQVI